jgi:hypothetical protein
MGMDHTRGDKVQLEEPPAHVDGMPGVVSPVVAGDQVGGGGEPVHDAALALITPLRADDDLKWHEYAPVGIIISALGKRLTTTPLKTAGHAG